MFQVWIHPCKQRTESQALPKPLLGYPNSRNPDPPTRGTSASDQVRDGDAAEASCVLRGREYLEMVPAPTHKAGSALERGRDNKCLSVIFF